MFLFIAISIIGVAAAFIWRLAASDKRAAAIQEAKRASVHALPRFKPASICDGSPRGYGIAVDPDNNLIAFTIPGNAARLYHFSQLVEVEVVRDGNTITTTTGKVDMKGAAIGTALLGPLGLLAGAKTSSNSQTKNLVSSLNLKVIVDDFYTPSYEISFLNFGVPLGAEDKIVKQAANELDAWYGRFRAIMSGIERGNIPTSTAFAVAHSGPAPEPIF